MKLFTPEAFQGNLKKKIYFEGWYFKHVSSGGEHVFSFIPGISLTKKDQHAFIQFIDGVSGQTEYIRYPLSDFAFTPGKLEVRIGESLFSLEGIDLNIQSPDFTALGTIDYSEVVRYPSGFFSPGIMGWYSFVPFMECKHGIGSVLHRLKGSLKLNGASFDFPGGTGYIEKDWGTSFPESWIWLHCNTFDEPECSFTFSVAKIPWLGSFFIGHICFLYLKGKFYIFATYNRSEITHIDFSGRTLDLEIKNRNYLLKVKAVQKKTSHLQAPDTGVMDRMIKESIDSGIELTLTDLKGEVLYEGTGNHAGMEVIEKILSYF